MVAILLAVCVGLNDPQVPMGVQDQFTPRFCESLRTTAVTGVVTLSNKNGGGCGSKATETGGGPLVMSITAEAKISGSVTEEAMTVTGPVVPGAV